AAGPGLKRDPSQQRRFRRRECDSQNRRIVLKLPDVNLLQSVDRWSKSARFALDDDACEIGHQNSFAVAAGKICDVRSGKWTRQMSSDYNELAACVFYDRGD